MPQHPSGRMLDGVQVGSQPWGMTMSRTAPLGDTLETVAEEQGTTVERLLILNPDVDPVALTIGQRIRVK